MNFSASDLVKKSAAQLLFIILKNQKYTATNRQLKGNSYASEIVKKENTSEEKRGVIKLSEDDLLFFCIDMVKDNKYVEIKMVDNENTVEDWYLNSSIIQSAFYHSLLNDVKSLDTPKFRKKEGFKQEVIQVIKNKEFELWFGKRKFKIEANIKLKNHFIKKALLIKECISTQDYDKCREFDRKYKFKEFDIFKPSFKQIK